MVIDEPTATYRCNRFQNSVYVPIGHTDISLVTSYTNGDINYKTNTYIPHIWKTIRYSNERVEFIILKSDT